ncbi:hypothetical protein [Gordonia sp. 852002-50395_SCH5434458]|uniref:hypothetical protein n=1 Tax=Gordonia sp. 852002-50395_SCH5434458 TaxID=1834090 RepID=UPI000A6827B0|nr:hypothetical protein [Gordonia sp. 852002-50395_SCH5434458]
MSALAELVGPMCDGEPELPVTQPIPGTIVIRTVLPDIDTDADDDTEKEKQR